MHLFFFNSNNASLLQTAENVVANGADCGVSEPGNDLNENHSEPKEHVSDANGGDGEIAPNLCES